MNACNQFLSSLLKDNEGMDVNLIRRRAIEHGFSISDLGKSYKELGLYSYKRKKLSYGRTVATITIWSFYRTDKEYWSQRFQKEHEMRQDNGEKEEYSKMFRDIIERATRRTAKESIFLKKAGINIIDYIDDKHIWLTKDYDKFKKLKAQRDVSESNINKKIENIDGYLKSMGGYMEEIEVNEKLEVIDGQHRIEVAKRLGLPLPFIIKEGWDIKTARALNSNNVDWSVATHVKSKADEGNLPGFKMLQEFYDIYCNNCSKAESLRKDIISAVVLGRYSGITSKESSREDVDLKTDKRETIVKYLEFLRKINSIRLENFSTKRMNATFAFAVLFLVREAKADMDKLYDVICRDSHILMPQSGLESSIRLLNDRYNFNKRKEYTRIDAVSAYKEYVKKIRNWRNKD